MDGQPVQQFRMTGHVTASPEVVTCLHQTHSKRLLPEAIDSHSGRQWVFLREEPTGQVQSVRRTVDEIRVTGGDAGARLAAVRPATTYRNKSAADVVKALAADAGVSPGDVDIDLDLAAYVAHQGRSAAEHIADLATLGGGIAQVDGDGALNVVRRPGAGPHFFFMMTPGSDRLPEATL